MYDFIRFYPEKACSLGDLGFKGFVFLTEEPNKDSTHYGRLIKASTVQELRKKLKKAKNSEIVGVYSSEMSVCREAIMRRKVDILLDGLDRRLDYATVMLAAEKDVAIELGLSKFLKKYGIRRMRLFEELYDEIRVINKFDTPFIITSAAESIYDMRTRIQIENFFSFFGADILKARFYAERLIRRYYDPKYVMDGFEVE